MAAVHPTHQGGEAAGTRKDIASFLRTSEKTVVALLESASQAILGVDRGGRIALANSRAQEMFGYTADELLGSTIEVLLPEGVRNTHVQDRTEYFARPRVRPMGIGMDLAARRKDGTEFPVEVSLSYMETGEGLFAIAFVSDISQRKRIEQKLEQSESRFRALIEQSSDAVCLINREGIILYASPPTERVLLYAPEELVGRNGLELVEPESLPLAQRRLAELIAMPTGGTIAVEVLVKRKDGRAIWTEGVGTNLLAESAVGAIVVNFRDITPRKQAEEAARKWEEVFLHAGFGVAIVDPEDQTLLAVNPAFAKMHGHTAEGLVGQSLAVTVAPESQGELLEHAQLAQEQGHHVYESLHIRKDGSAFPVFTDVTVFKDASGRLRYRAAYFRDISDRKQAEEALRESEESYRIVAETASDGIIKINDASEILFANPAVQDIFGYTPDELLGQPLTMLMPEYLRSVHRAAVKRYMDTGTRHINWRGVELPGLHKSGIEIPLEISFGEFVKDGKHVFTGVVRDITARKRLERRLDAQHAVTRILAEFSALSDIGPRILQALGESLGWPMGALWTVDRNEKVLRCAETWHGGSPATQEFEAQCRKNTFKIGVGLPGRVWQVKKTAWIPDVTRDSNFPRAPFAVSAGLHAAFGFPILLGAELLAVMEFFSGEIREPDTELLQTVDVIGSQIGQFLERKRLEEEIRQAQKLESIGVLAGGVAHDFNNLLIGVLGNASLALDALSPAHPSRAFVADVVRAAESAAHLTRQLLAYAGKGQFFLQPVDLSDLAGELTSLIQTSIPRSVHLRFELAKHLPSVDGDPGQLQQIIMNLVINGAEAIGEGKSGSVLLVTGVQDVDETYIRSTLAPDEIRPGKYVFLEVQDTGCGMDQDTLAKIFDPFFTTKFSGRGLGLAAVLGIVRGHKGAIKVYSTPGKGTTFKVLLPAIEERSGKMAEVATRELRGTGTVLVVDDEEMVRRTVGEMLKQHGYAVIRAASGHEATDIFREKAGDISLVLLDLTMPGMSGVETLQRLQGIRPNVKVILTSGYNEVEAIQRFAGKGLAGFIQKPYTARQLAERVKTVLETTV